MTKKFVKTISAITAVCILFTACNTTINVIDSKVRSALSESSRADEAIEWLKLNGDIVIPELVNRISNSGGKKSAQAAEALIAMGDYGRQGMIKQFDTMTTEGKRRICSVLAQQKDKQAVLELLALSQHVDAFDMAVDAIVSMGQLSLNYLEGMLLTNYYKEAVDSALSGFGGLAVDTVIKAVHSSDQQKVDRALNILESMGEVAVEDLAYDALNNTNSKEEAINIANIMLKNYPESAIQALISNITDDTDTDIAAALLYEVSGAENIGLVLTHSTNGTSESLGEILQQYVSLCGVDKVLNLVLSGDNSVSAGAKKALEGGAYDQDTFVAILNELKELDDSNSELFSLSNELIADNNLKLLAQAVIATDANAYAQAAANGMDTVFMGTVLSKCTDNEQVVERLKSISETLEGDYKTHIYMVFCCADDEYLPKYVLDQYQKGEANALTAGKALSQSPTANSKYLFDIDMSPYAGKILEGLNSGDDTLRSNAQIILSRVPTSKNQNKFYLTIFQYNKDKAIFTILASHYTGVGALPVGLSITNGSQTITPQTISISFTGDIKNVSSSNEPDYNTLITGFATYLNLTVVEEGADIDLQFDCDVTPRSKRYSGLLANSFLGAEAWGTLTASQNGTVIKTAEGYSLIPVPDEYPGPSGEFRYKADEEDAPSDEAYVICFINAMYKMFGEKVLFALYNYDANSTSQAAEELFS